MGGSVFCGGLLEEVAELRDWETHVSGGRSWKPSMHCEWSTARLHYSGGGEML